MAIYANIPIDQGSDYTSTVTVNNTDGLPFDLTGYTARGQIRKSYASTTFVSFTVVVADYAGGQLQISLARGLSAAMKAGRYLYDVEIVNVSTGAVTRVIEGQIEINPRITQL